MAPCPQGQHLMPVAPVVSHSQQLRLMLVVLPMGRQVFPPQDNQKCYHRPVQVEAGVLPPQQARLVLVAQANSLVEEVAEVVRQ